MTTDPIYARAVELAQRLLPLLHPEAVKAGRHRDRYPALAIEVSQLRTQFDARLMGTGQMEQVLEKAKAIAAKLAAEEVEKAWRKEMPHAPD